MPERSLLYIALFVSMMLSSASICAFDVELKTNPFERPVLSDSDADQHMIAKEPAAEMALLGTMAAGHNSLANIGGEILAIGETVNGYTIVSIEEHYVVLQKDDNKTTLLMDMDAEDKQ